MQCKRILVVDDDESVRSVIAYALKRLGYAVSVCATTEEALAQIKKERINLVILDLSLPLVNGFRLLERLRTEAETRSVAALVLTAYEDEEYRRRSFELGAKRFIVKPFSPRELVAAVAEIIDADPVTHERPSALLDLSDFKLPPALAGTRCHTANSVCV